MSAGEHLPPDAAQAIAAGLSGNGSGSGPAGGEQSWEPPTPLGRQTAIPPFPVEVLPASLGQYVTAVAEATQTPPDLAAMLILSVLATAAARKVVVEVRSGWREPVNLYIAVAMPPGSRKSPVFARVTAPLLAYERQALDNARPQIAEAAARKRIGDDLAHQAEKIAANADPAQRERLTAQAVAASETADAITVPPAPRLLADDATPEAVASLLAEQGGRLAILSAEGDVFDIMAGRYSKNGSANLGVFLKGWNGDDLKVDRKGRPPEHVEQPALTLGLAVQPEVLEVIARQPGFKGRGMLARFLYALPPSNVGHRLTNVAPVTEALEDGYRAEVVAMVTSLADVTDPVALPFTQAGSRRFERFEEALEPRLAADGGDLGHVADWGAKLAGRTAAIAGLLHLASNIRTGWAAPIGEESVRAAVTIADCWVGHALAVFDMMGADPAVSEARYVLAWVDRSRVERFTRRELFSALPRGRFAKVGDLEPALAVLTGHDYIRPAEPPDTHGRPGRKPSPVYLVNPLYRSAESAQSAQSRQRSHSADTADYAEPFRVVDEAPLPTDADLARWDSEMVEEVDS